MFHHKYLWGAAGLVGATALIASSTLAASTVYTFTLRGNVTAVDRTAKTVTVYPTQVSAKGQNDLAGNVTEFNVSAAKVYKYVSGKKVRITLGGIPVGNEVVMKGAKKSDDRYNVTEITVNDNSFTVVGTVRGHDTDNKIITVDVSYTSYKSATFKGKRISFYYGGNTKFYTYSNKKAVDMNADELANGDEKVQITGTVTNNNKWEALKVLDNYPKAQ
jgi:hypothetical protein